jgi:glycerophosphoryl diester phosphodiesterase
MILSKSLTFLLGLTVGFTMSCNREAASQKDSIHTLNISNTEDLKSFFRYTGNDAPLISGHRGGMVPGYPENSIETFENTLQHTPAFFEIDPRLTKDSIIVLMHDVTLDRTTNGSGKVSDFTLAELKKLKLKDKEGNVTEFRIPTLEEAIKWSKGKTILNLDKKDVPLEMTADIITRLNAASHVIVTVHPPEQAKFYLEKNSDIMFSAFIKTMEAFEDYENAGIPWSNVAIAYVGPRLKTENQELYRMLHERGVKYMVSTASSDDRLEDPEARKQAWKEIAKAGVDVIESDLPIEVANSIKGVMPVKNTSRKFFGEAAL